MLTVSWALAALASLMARTGFVALGAELHEGLGLRRGGGRRG